mmetsp:Transcript_117905/g.333477  ORF Transcript_117905/g.333477 Transcript_117905/m.333477 type:complete len:206 (+) Transcript_117905:2057-2674(+)
MEKSMQKRKNAAKDMCGTSFGDFFSKSRSSSSSEPQKLETLEEEPVLSQLLSDGDCSFQISSTTSSSILEYSWRFCRSSSQYALNNTWKSLGYLRLTCKQPGSRSESRKKHCRVNSCSHRSLMESGEVCLIPSSLHCFTPLIQSRTEPTNHVGGELCLADMKVCLAMMASSVFHSSASLIVASTWILDLLIKLSIISCASSRFFS